MITNNTILHSLIRLFLSALVTLLVGLVVRVLIENYLGINTLGLYALFLTIYLISADFLTFNLPNTFTKFLSERKSESDKAKLIETFYGLSIGISFLSVAIFQAIVYLSLKIYPDISNSLIIF